ncbi:phosphoribosylamine--glycine ligase [Phaeovibrio sulfidiphilus]|uniref:Phosphoribosylamine--glycine ligase n=1 Tax=Phaeovibrio sulfidiphilus TaxID=1220600 RepID=A0A8J6YKU3_9PROT|nr:phosphoribosylamine--glycine ligase [Phaeovibrio sulfidiphilus]MBE1236475.1 phosphoribosylamine--glycine ligase [Phaeovibrio sulfidiphilus]
MKVLVLGSGGREHALCWKLARSPLCQEVLCAPGNVGIGAVARCVPVAPDDGPAVVALAREEGVGLVVVGPEAPLVAGVADALREAGIPVFGPGRGAARLEESKAFMKDIASEAGVPTAAYASFTDPEAAKAYIRKQGGRLVVKADGLAAGKGVILCDTPDEAVAAVDLMMNDRAFGASGDTVVVEEFLEGEEVSFFVLCDGTRAIPLAGAQDHKAVGDGDTGPNTGGMGAYSPAPVLTPELQQRVMAEIIEPTLATMAARGTPYSGVLFAGLMVSADGPRLLEYNVRFGDPECQVLMMRLDSDLLPALLASAQGDLSGVDLTWSAGTALVVVMAAEGYPGTPRTGTEIRGLERAAATPGVQIFHAGTRPGPDGSIVAAGGRVLGVAAGGSTVAEARERAYEAVDRIDWPEGFCRRDIAWRALER